jgi:hypothetical protein
LLRKTNTQGNYELEAVEDALSKLDRIMTKISLEAERSIKPRGSKKWSRKAIRCQKEYVAYKYQKQKAKQQSNNTEVNKLTKIIKKEQKARVTTSRSIRYMG